MLIILFGLADLLLTVHAMRTTGMYEDNPLVIWLIRNTNSPLALIAFKLSTLAVGVGLLRRFRYKASATIGAGIAAAALGGVLVMWLLYYQSLDGLDLNAIVPLDESNWIRL